MPPPTDERALIRAWSERGDERAVGQLWDAHQRTAVAIAARVLRGTTAPLDEAREVADDAFLRALGAYEPERTGAGNPRPFRSFYLTITRNLAIDRARRLGREVRLSERELPADDPRARLDDGLDLRAALPRLREEILARYLPQDWRLLERWMAHRSEGSPVPWKALTVEFPIEITDRVRFDPQRVEPAEAAPIDAAARVLNACPQAHADVIGSADPSEDPALAARRATVVARAMEQRLERRIAHDRASGQSAPRLRVRVDETTPAAEVRFEVTRGRIRTPDALRMRVEKVLLGHARALLRSDRT